MSGNFPKITILGGGLLGGSLALSLAELPSAPAISLWGRRPEFLADAEKLGITGATTDLAAAVQDASLIILAVPVGAMPRLLSDAIAAGIPSDCLITDVGSVKCQPHKTLAPLLAPHGIHFIGSHPMAGSERNGLSAASASLFNDAACLLTNDEHAPANLTTALETFWKSIGCRTTWMSAAIHDELVARISHLPHVIAASGSRVCLRDPSEGRFGGGGLRDTTRVASGNPAMWAEILIENREALIGPLRESIADLSAILAALESSDQPRTHQWLAEAKHLRDSMRPNS